MKFGPVPVRDALGAVLAHSLSVGGTRLRKGLVLSSEDISMLVAAGLSEVVVAQIGDNDEAEDVAASRLGNALAAPGFRLSNVTTGRINLVADTAGVVRVDLDAVNALNAINEGMTLATLPDFARVDAGQLVATIKIIPYGLPTDVSDAGLSALPEPPITMHAFQGGVARLVLTKTEGFKESLLVKGEAVVRARVEALGYSLDEVVTVAHEQGAISGVLEKKAADLTLILGASATSDRHDVAPRAVVAAGGQIDRFGMPVDPGNLLFLGTLKDGSPVVGLPGCARSPALNGVDWVLERLAAGLAVSGDDIARMGVGGLLKEMPGRPQPREW